MLWPVGNADHCRFKTCAMWQHRCVSAVTKNHVWKDCTNILVYHLSFEEASSFYHSFSSSMLQYMFQQLVSLGKLLSCRYTRISPSDWHLAVSYGLEALHFYKISGSKSLKLQKHGLFIHSSNLTSACSVDMETGVRLERTTSRLSLFFNHWWCSQKSPFSVSSSKLVQHIPFASFCHPFSKSLAFAQECAEVQKSPPVGF